MANEWTTKLVAARTHAGTRRSKGIPNGLPTCESVQFEFEGAAQRRDIHSANARAIADPHVRAPEPGLRSRDDPRMFGLLRNPSSPIAAALALCIGLAPLDRAHASEPPAGFAEAPPEPEHVEEPSGEALRIVADEPITFAEPPAPTIEPEPTPAPAVRVVDSRRPMVGTGLIVLGALGMSASTVMIIAGMTGPGWADLSRRDSAIIGGLSLPVGLASLGMVLGGSQANNKYQQWGERNGVTPPRPGNGVLVGGAAVTMLGVAGIGGGIQLALTDDTPSRGNWAVVGASGAITAIGLVILANGMITRSKFAAWERGAALQPGTMALRGGAGLTLSGRF